ncbi:MAG: discoidin domain-containing protein [Opitutales bacterium]|nr:discoidin domain-containing protein [Opitutales bacterium]
MKIKPIICLFLSVGASCFGVDINSKEAQNAWNDVSIFRINKEPARAFFVPYADSSKVPVSQSCGDVENLYENTDRAKVLNGKWKFFFAEKPEEISPEFFKKDFDDSKWDEIEVPNSWQACGYDSIFYANINLEMFFDKNGRWLKGFHKGKGEEMSQAAKSPFIPEMHRQKAVYRTSFELPKGWESRETIIRFNGVRTGFFLYVNGKKVGYSEDSFTPAEFNIAKFLKAGKNSIAVEVFKNTTGAYFEMQDMPHMMGIIRDVVLLSRPKFRISDYFADVSLGENLDEAKINLTVFFNGSENSEISASIVDKSGNAVFKKSAKAGGGKAEISGVLKNFKLWSPDRPDFYTLILEQSQNGKVLEAAAADIAFRKFEIKGKTCYLNGKCFLIKGANVHAWSPDKGKACSFEWMKKDVELMREANINAVRTSHYPPDDKFLMLCTRYGITIMDEANHETHGLRDEIPGDNEWFFPMSLDRMKNMVLRDRNVPSVIIWSLGNENAWRFTKNHQVMLDFAREFGGGRPVHSEVEMRDPLTLKNERLNSPTDFVSGMYGGLPRIKWYQTKMRNETRPFIFCEYMHSMGNSTGNLKEIWDEFRKDSSLNGGYLWDWVDQSLLMPRKDNPNEKYLTWGVDWGTKPTSGNFCLNGIIFADRTYSGKFDEVRRVHQNAQFEDLENPYKFKVSNEFTAVNLNEFDFEIEVLRNGKVAAQKAQKPLDIAPWESAEIEIDAAGLLAKDKELLEKSPDRINAEYFLNLSLKDRKTGRIVATHQRYLGAEKFGAEKPNAPKYSFKKISEDKDFILVRFSGNRKNAHGAMDLKFSKKDANLIGATLAAGKARLITEPLDFDISQAWIDSMKPPMRDYEMHGLDSLQTKMPQVVFDGKSVACKKFLVNEDGAGFLSEIRYSPCGQSVRVDCKFTKVNDLPEKLNLARIGVRMGIEKTLKNVEYYGRGPLANYCDRKTGADVGIYSSDVKSFLELFPKTQDTGNREDVRNMVFSADKPKFKLAFSAIERPLPFAVLPNSQAEMKLANHPHELPQNSNSELRIAWNVFGIGNSSHGPETLEQYRHFFKGSVEFSFDFGVVSADASPESLASKREYSNSSAPKKYGENLQDESVLPTPSGKVISYGADVKLSSVDEKWSPKLNDFTTEGAQNFAFHTLKEKHPNVVVDLKEAHPIAGIQISNRADHMAFRTAPIGVYISSNGADWEKVFESKLAKKRWHINLKGKNKSARFIKIVLEKPEAEALHLKKIAVF